IDRDCCTFCAALLREAISSCRPGSNCVLVRVFGFSKRQRSLWFRNSLLSPRRSRILFLSFVSGSI
ncbi:hypothetical protein BDZ91DRAFT_753315, partial [Kalaharituber pfeilii]